ncbi:MAG TPA: glycosyltransferase, partial [Acidobacteriota bacterium]|nr:glycosyltransferase [Acidobacteriota bacterium]
MASQTTAVIVNWNGARFLKPLLESLGGENLAATILIDNASEDDSLKVAGVHREIRLIRNEANVGFGVAANQGIDSSQTPYVLILNADTEIVAGAVNELEQFLSNHPEAAIVAPKLLFSDGKLQSSCRTFPTILKYTLFLSYLDRVIPTGYRLSKKEHACLREVDQPMGAAL